MYVDGQYWFESVICIDRDFSNYPDLQPPEIDYKGRKFW